MTDVYRWCFMLCVITDDGQHILFVCFFRKEKEDDGNIGPPRGSCECGTGPVSGWLGVHT